VAHAKAREYPDPLGKRALFWVPSGPGATGPEPHGSDASTMTVPMGKHALYSGARPESDTVRRAPSNPRTERGRFTVVCQRCRQASRIGLLDLVILQFPFGVWIPRGRFDRRMTCPSCRKRAWCSVTLRRE